MYLQTPVQCIDRCVINYDQGESRILMAALYMCKDNNKEGYNSKPWISPSASYYIQLSCPVPEISDQRPMKSEESG